MAVVERMDVVAQPMNNAFGEVSPTTPYIDTDKLKPTQKRHSV
jgi:hypothetical protein